MLEIGKLKLMSPYILSPLAGVSDLPFRLICRDYGCELAFVEMISAHALVYENRKTLQMISTCERDRPLGIQLLAEDPDLLCRAIDIIRPYKFDIIDFNAGCPVYKVTRTGKGAVLYNDSKKLNELLKILVLNSDAPVTVKIRSGWDAISDRTREIALCAQDAGIKALFIHGRAASFGYDNQVDYDIIKMVKETLYIPVIASGDILSAQLAKKMYDTTGCDGVVVARGAMGNPWIFQQIDNCFKNGAIIDNPGFKEIIETMLLHFNLCTDFYGEHFGVRKFRKIFKWYTKGFPHIKEFRDASYRVTSKKEYIELMLKLKEKLASSSYSR